MQFIPWYRLICDVVSFFRFPKRATMRWFAVSARPILKYRCTTQSRLVTTASTSLLALMSLGWLKEPDLSRSIGHNANELEV